MVDKLSPSATTGLIVKSPDKYESGLGSVHGGEANDLCGGRVFQTSDRDSTLGLGRASIRW